MTLVRFEPAAPQSLVKLSTAEPLRYLIIYVLTQIHVIIIIIILIIIITIIIIIKMCFVQRGYST